MEDVPLVWGWAGIQRDPLPTLAAYFLNDKEFMAGLRRGSEDWRNGRVRSWAQIKRELFDKEAM